MISNKPATVAVQFFGLKFRGKKGMKSLKNTIALNVIKSSGAVHQTLQGFLSFPDEPMVLLGHAQSKPNPAFERDRAKARPLNLNVRPQVSLIHDIQAAAIAKDSDIPTLLRMCKLLAARISHQEFADWVDRELNGYPSVKGLPDYRVVRVDSYGSFIGTFARADKLQIPVSVLPKELQEQFRNAYMGSSISAYTALLSGDKPGSVQEPWPVALAVHNASKLTPDMQCVSAWKEIPIGAVVRLMDSVKTRVLGFAIDLERAAPDAGELPIGSQPPLSREKMTQIFNTNITGNVGNIANASSGFSQSTTTVEQGNWQTLQSHLLALGFSPGDIEGLKPDLERAVATGIPEDKTKIASTWIGRLAGKAASGAAGVGIEVAAAGVAKAIAAYFGIAGA